MKNLLLLTSIILLMAFINLSFADGVETFANFPETGNSYQDGTFEGQDGSNWEYWQCRGDQIIDDQTPCLGKDRTPTSEITSGTISDGFGTINFDYMQAFSSGVNLDVYVNDLLIGNVTSSGELGIVKNSGDIEVDIDGDVVITFIQNNTGSGQVSIDNFAYTSYGGGNPDPEPSNYPIDFTATNAGLSVNLEWTDAVGTQLPSAYIIMAGINSSLPVPVDGTPVSNDTDLSDGSGAINVPFGEEMTAFENLEGNTTYYFSIYPYTNNGSNIDFKTDGTAPTANASTLNIIVIESENFDDSWGNWTRISLVGTQVWVRDTVYGMGGTGCAKMAGYESGSYYENDDWLISPPLNLDDYENEVLVFYNAYNYDGPDMELKISANYDGGGDPTTATWTTESFLSTSGYFVWTESGNIDMSAYEGNAVYVAFQFTSTDAESATWEVDNITISGEEDIVIVPEPTNYPMDFEAFAADNDITLFWEDATGTQLPSAYIIFAGTSASLPTPEDGTPVSNDTDLSDGSGALNVAYGMEEIMFADLMQGTTYYFSIYPYTNNGGNIDYKNDGTAPTATEDIPSAPEPTNYPTDFLADATTTTINITWADASGVQLPEAYIIYANTDQASLPVPADGTAVADDTDISDGSGAINVSYGMESTMFADLAMGTTYYFSIYPYTNSGSNIDFKNDGTSPSAMATTIIINEPTNYPTSFEAAPVSTTINLTWADATGDQLPESYIIFAGTSASLPTPTDGTPVTDDLDLSDGMGAVNVDYGIEEFSFSSLEASTTYYFSIYPYVGSGVDINYKNDGTAPSADAMTEETSLLVIESENFNESWGNWTTVSLVGSQVWDRNNTYGIDDTPCAAMTGYEGQAYANDDWLISPALDLDEYDNEILVFQNALGYTGPDLQLKVSNDYDGGGDPGSANWTTESFTMSAGFFEWTESGEINLSGYDGSAVYVAFHFTSTDSESATWEVDNIVISGEEKLSSDKQLLAGEIFNIYPNPTSDYLFIEKSGNDFTTIQIMSATGNIVKSVNATSELTKIDLTALSNGIYIITFRSKETGLTTSHKFILK